MTASIELPAARADVGTQPVTTEATRKQSLNASKPRNTPVRVRAQKDRRLAFESGDLLVKQAQRTDVTNWAERDQVLSALLERVLDGPEPETPEERIDQWLTSVSLSRLS